MSNKVKPETENLSGTDDVTSTGDQPDVDNSIKTTPTIKPTIVWLTLVVLVGIGLIAYVNTRRGSFSNPETADILTQIVTILTLIGVIRFLIRIYILKRTRYVIDQDSITRRYDLLYRSQRREVPLAKVRSHELRQSRIQKLLGYGTIRINQGLGPIELENIPEPYNMYEVIQRFSKSSGSSVESTALEPNTA